jgi:ectoine hydroxylase-related dioxygenase (phytanoyl-CoA dioxygenase family)
MSTEGLDPLLPADRTTFDDQGFLVVRNALTPAHVMQLRTAIATACNLDLNRRESWPGLTVGRNGRVDLYHHQSQWDARQSPVIYSAFASVLRSTRLWVSIDRAKLQVPIRRDAQLGPNESFIHWDVDLRRPPRELMVQGILCLSTASHHHGGFHCVPGFHRDARRIAAKKSWNPWSAAAQFSQKDIHVVNAAEGDLIIWNSLLPHGAGINHSDQPRIAQFLRMFPAEQDNLDLVARRRSIWSHRLSPGGMRTLDAPAAAAKLTPLGRRLVGIDRWT